MNSELLDSIVEIVMELHPDRVDTIVDKITSLSSVEDLANAKSEFYPRLNDPMISNLEKTWRRFPETSSKEIAVALQGASRAIDTMGKRESIEMVWTGPTTGLVASRHTEQVLKEIINSAETSLFLVSFVAYNMDPLLLALREAIGRNVAIDILVESSISHGGKIDVESAELLKKGLPTANFYEWKPESKSSFSRQGAVHAKCAVADGCIALVTSANLTRAAMESNMELGVLIRGGDLPNRLTNHLEALIKTGIIERIEWTR